MAHGKRTNGYSNLKFWGYRRENGRVGVRNHVVILPLDDLSNAACEAVANNIKGTLALPHAYGRLQFGEDLDLHFRTLIGTVAKAARVAKDYLQRASEQKREECDVSELWVSTKCGESDTTTGLASCPTVGNMYDKLIPVG